MSIKPVLSDHLSYMTLFHCFLGRSNKTGFIVLTWRDISTGSRIRTLLVLWGTDTMTLTW